MLTRAAAKEFRGYATTPLKRLTLCKHLLEGTNQDNPAFRQFSEALTELPIETRHYWVGTFYSLLLPPSARRRQAVYFTPPHLAESIVDLVIKEGFQLNEHTVIDPAAGGAAFLSTVANRMIAAKTPLNVIKNNLRGIEIDSGLAILSEILIGERLGSPIQNGSIVRVGNSLSKSKIGTFDLVIANPPYGRLKQTDLAPKKWENVCYSGHINKYALFAELSCNLAKSNGLVALIMPSSFVAGPLYDRLRSFLRNIGQTLLLGAVLSRHDVFADVAQDVSVLVLRKGEKHDSKKPIVFGRFNTIGGFKAIAAVKLPEQDGDPWHMPAGSRDLALGGCNLESYDAKIKAGYFVWNRERKRMKSRQPTKITSVPLVWAKNVQAGSFCVPQSKKKKGIDFVCFEGNTSAIIRSNAIIIQRTTNSAQKRRLIAARISPSVLKKWGGFITENHTLVLTAKDIVTLNDLCVLLNSKAVDLRYRQVSGTASVSVTLLRNLDLPDPVVLRECLSSIGDQEKAVEEAYKKSRVVIVARA